MHIQPPAFFFFLLPNHSVEECEDVQAAPVSCGGGLPHRQEACGRMGKIEIEIQNAKIGPKIETENGIEVIENERGRKKRRRN